MSPSKDQIREQEPPSKVAASGTTTLPIYLKKERELPWPEGERTFYVLARNGLFLCREHPFYKSCAPARSWPSGLERQESFLEPSFPLVPRDLFQQVVGFFDRIAELHNSEAAAFFAWDRSEECVRLVVPEQTATVSTSWGGKNHPVGLHYTPPTDLPLDWVIFGDIHSHVHLSAYASATDVEDEENSAGLHVVVGRIHHEPPELHVEAVVDGARFSMEAEEVFEGYDARDRDVPDEWIDRVRVEPYSWKSSIGPLEATPVDLQEGRSWDR